MSQNDRNCHLHLSDVCATAGPKS